MSIQLSKPLVVPEYNNALVKLYVTHPVTLATVPLPSYTINVQSVLTALIPGRIARANACALNGNDLFIANSSIDLGPALDSQCIFKVPNYLVQGGLAMVQTFIVTQVGNDYVGIAFDRAGNLYVAEGNSKDNHIVRYTGADKAYPGPVAAAMDNFTTRVDMGNAGATSYFANLAFDAAGNLWASDAKNHRLVVFDAANLGGMNTYHVLMNPDNLAPVDNDDAAFQGNTSHLFAEPEGIDFDAAGNLWVANNNDGLFGIKDSRTSLAKITPALQATVLAAAGPVKSTVDFSIYQVPNLLNDTGASPQFGGLQVDREAKRIYVNEQIAGKGRGYDIETIKTIGKMTAANDLDIVSTNPGNGGIALINTELNIIMLAAVDTADPKATIAAKAVYTYLTAAPMRPDHRLVIGQALRGWDFTLPVAQPITALTGAGLPAPKFIEVDLTDFGVTSAHDTQLINLLLAHAGAGGLIGFSFHVGNPFTGGGVYDRNSVDLPQLADPVNPMTPAGTRWKDELDRIADIMQRFADAVVLFRPLHESNGNWFWWGQTDPVDFQATWQGMVSYLNTSKGLHNLLWVYSAARNSGGALFDPTRLYPGASTVDIVGLDIYDDDLSDAEPGEPGYAALVALGKPFGITEYGAANFPTNHDGAVHLPNDKVIQLIKLQYPNTVLATAWYSQSSNNWQISDKPNPLALLGDPWSITL